MSQTGTRFAARTVLLAATCLTAAPAFAQEQSVEDRLDRLEALVEGLIERLDAQAGETAQQNAAMQAQQDTMRLQAEAALEATRALEARQTELSASQAQITAQQTEMSAKIIDFPIPEGEGFQVGKTRITYDGYVKFDAISQRTSGGQLPGNSILRDFLIPVAIPVGGEPSGFDTDFSARQTRFLFKTETDVGTEHKLSGLIELDFNVTEGGNERISNSFVPRIRNALINYDNWTFGQGWSTFQNVGALPDTLDFIGVTPGTVFDRQPLIRYTNGGLQIAIEQPETVITAQDGSRVIAGDDQLPDIVGRYNWSGDWGSFTAAGIVRQLHVSTDDLMGVDDSAWGYGLSLSGKLKVGEQDDFRFMATAGDGLGRYIGLNIVNDAAIKMDGTLDPIYTYSGFAAYRHIWADNLRSNVAGSYFKADNPVRLTTNQVTDESWNTFVNLIWTPVGPINIGVELMYAERILEDGSSGNLQRVQFSTQYNF
ncbi:MAG: DcaP family trimeric outer membrane transporter [Erythrobacter sp.]|uniref:DcaP family trimeric outer membrane transporter n=1 Tax=Erythrobacter sp. TaxID=1042 RepID=UPI00261BAA23|nr:DcaP family trimeric outer membrane transporter [Erythrobacter sp.]MDJ0979642.1 DcaP family trimeric outer membrane transporter [Erythrobacter sp.]